MTAPLTKADTATAAAFAAWLDANWTGGALPPLKTSAGVVVSTSPKPSAQWLAYWAYVQKIDPKAPLLAAIESFYWYQLAKTGLGDAIGKAVTAGGTAVGAVDTGVSTASYLPSWATGLGTLLGDLTNKNTWLRVAEGLLGIILIAVGLAHMTHAVPIATAIASKVP
jgi:hypothetical protein